MIYKQCVLTIANNTATLDEDVYLYRLDKNIELYFTIVNNKYKFDKSDLNNIISITNASYFQMRLYKNEEVKYTFAIQPTDEGKAILTITDDLIDEPIEVGDYDFQISLLDADKSSMVSMPIAKQQLHVCEPLVADASETGTAVLGLSQLDTTGEIVDAFDENGNYIRKVHVNGEIISAELFNKWETALDTNTKNIAQVSSQYKDIAKKVENVGNPTQEQINTAIDKAIEDGKITGSGGLNSTAKTLLETILQNAIYTTDQSANITSLMSALSSSGGDTPSTIKYTITNTLTKCTNSNTNTSVTENTSYIATITPNTGYKLDTVTVTMSGKDVTSTVYSNGKITINSVTGDIVITATAIEKQAVVEMPTNGLIALFDKDSESITNGAYPAYQYQIKSKLNDDYVLGSWNKQVSETNEYGVKALTGSLSSNKQTGTTIDSPTTWVVCSYLPTISINGYAPNNLGNLGSNFYFINAVPVYVNTNNESKNAENISSVMGDRSIGYHRLVMVIDGNYFKVYKNGKLLKTLNGSDYSDFSKWQTPTGITGGFSDKTYTYFDAIYNRALSDVEVVELDAYIQTLEVNK